MTTLGKIAEQIKLFGGHSQTGEGMHIEEVKLLVGQVVNILFKTEKIKEITGMGNFSPGMLMVATYDNVPVYEYKDRSAAKLPVYPIHMPMNMGIWYVAPSDNIDRFFVPLVSGQSGLAKPIKLLNNFENRIAYEPNGDQIVFSKNILKTDDPITTLMVRMLVLDISTLDEYDPLPIPADMEGHVIEEVLKLMGVRKPTETVNNPKDHS